MTRGARFTADEYEMLKARVEGRPEPTAPKPNKYHAVPTMRDAIRFQSKKEAAFYDRLVVLQKCGEVRYFLRQVPFDLPGGVKYRVDFQVFYTNERVEYFDVKGVRTETYKLKRKQVEALYPVTIVEA